MEADKQLFSQILAEDEQILKIYRPHKFRSFFGKILGWVLLAVLITVFVGFVSTAEASDAESSALIGTIVYLAVIAAFAIISFVLTALWVNKTVYAVTNKRILIRTGRIGVDYKSLDFDMLGAITVNVDWLDKLLHKNTGTIAFGSMSSPMVSNGISRFTFSYIKDPYVIYKEVKAIMDSNKQSK